MIKVHSRAQTRTDRAGDPLDGLVNMFDVGIVLAVAFLVAALQSLHLTQALSRHTTSKSSPNSIALSHNQKLITIKPGTRRVAIKGAGRVGSVYQLPDGRLVYVAKK